MFQEKNQQQKSSHSDKKDAAKIILDNINSKGVIYPTKGLVFVKYIFKILPTKFIDLIESLIIKKT